LHRYFVNEIYPPLGNRRLVEVTALDIQQIVFRKRDNGFEAAAAQIRNLFKRLFDYAITCQIVSVNPAHATRRVLSLAPVLAPGHYRPMR
jgi:hypothetical protein